MNRDEMGIAKQTCPRRPINRIKTGDLLRKNCCRITFPLSVHGDQGKQKTFVQKVDWALSLAYIQVGFHPLDSLLTERINSKIELLWNFETRGGGSRILLQGSWTDTA